MGGFGPKLKSWERWALSWLDSREVGRFGGKRAKEIIHSHSSSEASLQCSSSSTHSAKNHQLSEANGAQRPSKSEMKVPQQEHWRYGEASCDDGVRHRRIFRSSVNNLQ